MSTAEKATRVRFAPSPTGALHIGGARTALYNWLAARHDGGTMVLRIEDTDLERSTPENVAQILDALRWLDLDWDEGPISQVGRANDHAAALQKLLDSGAAYPDSATAEDVKAWKAEHGADRGYRGTPSGDGSGAIRLRVPDDGDTVVDDLIRGEVRFPNRSYDDFVIARNDGSVLYNFAVAVDDADMGITEVIRGDDHLSNTPKQLLVFEALGIKPPRYAHVPLLHGPDGKKLSKRHGAASVQELRDAGYLPEAVVNYLARLGWSHGDDEIFSRQQLTTWFDLDHITASAAQFNTEKLNWLNAHYIKQADDVRLAADVAERLVARGVEPSDGPALSALIALYKDRAATLVELADGVEPFYRAPAPSPELLAEQLTEASRGALADLSGRLATIDWQREAINGEIKTVMKAHGLKMPQVAIPLRVALLGVKQTPSIDAVVEAMGRERVLARIGAVL